LGEDFTSCTNSFAGLNAGIKCSGIFTETFLKQAANNFKKETFGFSNKIKPFCKPLLIDASCSQKLKNINSILAKQNSNYQIELPKSCVEAANNSSGFTAKFIIKEPVNQKADVKVIGNVPSTKK
jgi:hypothetical protein